jgi:hypothetical protein
MSNSTPKNRVYLLECQGQGLYKIGYAQSLRSRISAIQSSNPYTITLIDSFPTLAPWDDEQAIHAQMKKYHYKGEWFKFPKQLIDNRAKWFHSYTKVDPLAIKAAKDQEVERMAKFAASFFSEAHFRNIAGLSSNADARYLKRHISKVEDTDALFDDAIERSYEASIRSGLTHDQAVAKIQELIQKDIREFESAH